MTKDEQIAIGKRIAKQRKNLKLTQNVFSEEIELSSQMISAVETGAKGISVDTAIKISSTLKISIDYLLTGAVSDYSDTSYGDKISRLSPMQLTALEGIIDSFLSVCE